ncbi:MAG: PTS sugar transporter subunit IIA [Alphaproteobacteria bacterium]|nr:PTS sugar transporter subunit IIA [Alphaproteobacteria bacterium]
MTIGVVIVSHGRLAEEFIRAAEHVVGPQTAIRAICIGAEDDMERRRGEIAEAARAVDSGRGTVVLTDMFGGTPSNLAISLLDGEGVEVLAGVNLPALIKLLEVRKRCSAAEAVKAAQEAGRKYIAVVSEMLPAEARKKHAGS